MTDLSIVDRAREFAIQAHGPQLYGERPYSEHLMDTVKVLIEYGHVDSVMLAAAWLHDVVEDTQVTREIIAETFGPEVESRVWAVTSEPGKNRAERNAKTYPKLRLISYAITLKLADRIANVRNAMENDKSGLFRMYQREYQRFRAELKEHGGDIWMWIDLDRMMCDVAP